VLALLLAFALMLTLVTAASGILRLASTRSWLTMAYSEAAEESPRDSEQAAFCSWDPSWFGHLFAVLAAADPASWQCYNGLIRGDLHNRHVDIGSAAEKQDTTWASFFLG
jgi:hypothetical protein